MALVSSGTGGSGKRVVVLINDMNASGGIQRVAANITRILAAHHDARLLSVMPLDNPVFYQEDDRFESLDLQRDFTTGYAPLIKDLIKGGLRLRKYVIKNKIDVVLAIWYDWSCVSAVFLPDKVLKVGWEHIAYEEAGQKWRKARERFYRHLDIVVAPTERDKKLYNRFSKRTLVIPNMVPAQPKVDFSQREPMLLMVGSLIYRKGIDRLLWALRHPLKEHPNWRFVVVGGGEKSHFDSYYLIQVEALIRLLGIEDQVEFHPATRDIESYYRRASVLLMGSRQEGLPMVMLEAKSYGLPIISFDCPSGPGDIVRHGVDGFLIKDDTVDYAAAVRTLITDPELRKKMGEAAVEDIAQRYSEPHITAKWLSLIGT